MDMLLIVLALVIVVLVVVIINLVSTMNMRKDTVHSVNSSIDTLSKLLTDNQNSSALMQEERLKNLTRKVDNLTIENNRQLDRIRETVDEKLQETLESRISKSFQMVSERLEQVYKGLGEMQTLATGVGDLKKVLSNVKTRGILGEIQLGAILEEILSPEQYEENIKTRSTGSERVEFAIKMPGSDGSNVYLPIDAKFPGDAYEALLDAYDTGDKTEISAKTKNLEIAIKKAAKDINTKYMAVQYTLY